jgi:hypothetical protein
MAKKRKRTTAKPGWEYEEVDEDDEEVISSGRDIVMGSRPSTSGLKSNKKASSRRTVYEIDSSSGESSSESAEETDESFEQVRSTKSKRSANGNKGKRADIPRPVAKQKVNTQKENKQQENKQKGNRAVKGGKKIPIQEDPEIKDIALSSLDNDVFVIGKPSIMRDDCPKPNLLSDAILRADFGDFGDTALPCWHYTIKWHGFTIAQTAHETPIPAACFDGDGAVIADFWRDLQIPTSDSCITRNGDGFSIPEPKKRPGPILASPDTLGK